MRAQAQRTRADGERAAAQRATRGGGVGPAPGAVGALQRALEARSSVASQARLQRRLDQSARVRVQACRAETLGASVVQPKLAIGPIGDSYEHEADRVARQVVSEIHAPAASDAAQREAFDDEYEDELRMKPLATAVQRQELLDEDELQMKPRAGLVQRDVMDDEDEKLQMKPQPAAQRDAVDDEYEDELQMKPRAGLVQRDVMDDEDEELQMKPQPAAQREAFDDEYEDELQMKPRVGLLQRAPGSGGFDAAPDVEATIQRARGGGQALPDAVRQLMEQAMGADFSGVRVHHDGRADQLNQSIQAKAFTTGQDLFFRQGEYNPGSRGGQELLAHELTHVMQQSGEAVQRRATVQRVPAWTRQSDDAFDAFVTALDGLVNDSADSVLKAPVGIPNIDGYTNRWIALVTSFADAVQSKGSLQAGLQEEPFIYAAFGYAVESLTNAKVATGALDDKLPKDTAIKLQATRGATRPDLVVKGKAGDVGWFDITASASETHIWDKSGSGWTTRPYVAEVTYPSLTAENLLKLAERTLGAAKGLSGEELDQLGQRVAEHKKRQREQLDFAGVIVTKALAAVADVGNLTTRRAEFEAQLGARLGLTNEEGETIKVSPGVAKGFLTLLWPSISTSYAKIALEAGYKNDKARNPNTEQAKELIFSL